MIDGSFGSVVPPALPAAWVSQATAGPSAPWTTSTSIPGGGAGSKAAFHGELGGGSARVMTLLSPAVTVPTLAPGQQAFVTLDFDVATSLEDQPGQKTLAWDGMCVRLWDFTGGSLVRTVMADAFAEAIQTGSSDGYPKRTPRGGISNYFATASVWSGKTLGFQHVSMRFPAEGLSGRQVAIGFEYTEDQSGVCTNNGYPGPCGVAIDNVAFRFVPLNSQPCAPVAVAQREPVAFALQRVWPNPSRSGALNVEFSLPDASQARLEVLDVPGRRVSERSLDGMGEGRHTVALSGAERLAPGLYFVRLEQGVRQRTVRVAVIE